MNAVVRPREGNRSRGYLQGVYPTAADDAWVALCVRDDADWAHMVEAMGRPELLERILAHDEFDTVVADWTRTQTAAKSSMPLAHGMFRQNRCLHAESDV